MLFWHFRALPLEDVPGFSQLPSTIGIVLPDLTQSRFQPPLPFWNPPFILEAHFVCPEHLGINKSVAISCLSAVHKPLRRSHAALVRRQSFMVPSCRLSS